MNPLFILPYKPELARPVMLLIPGWIIPVNQPLWKAFDVRAGQRRANSAWVGAGQVGLQRSKVKRGWWVGQCFGWKAAGQTQLCCHKHCRYMNRHKPVRGRDKCVWAREGGRGSSREWRSGGGRPWVYSQCCDMFVMFSHRGDSQTACFHFTVWRWAAAGRKWPGSFSAADIKSPHEMRWRVDAYFIIEMRKREKKTSRQDKGRKKRQRMMISHYCYWCDKTDKWPEIKHHNKVR